MRPGPISVEWIWTKPFECTQRNIRKWLKQGLWRALEFWHKTFLRFHFTNYAYSRYGSTFKRRRMRRKRFGKYGTLLVESMRPLYETGLTRSMALSYMRGSGVTPSSLLGRASGVPAGKKTVTVKGTFNVPNYLKFIKRWGYDPDKELTVMNRAELTKMAAVVDAHIQMKIDTEEALFAEGRGGRMRPAAIASPAAALIAA